ncbi:MAG: aldo/keto reductase [Oscillospiraceae bacterium]|nr:aldo/keto reductase [Oscillospiraceae bacterium]
MQYRPFGKTGDTCSALGFGCMRLPEKDGAIDEATAAAMLRGAIDRGLNYVDTAYDYHNRQSEAFVGRALGDGYRNKVLLATKAPEWHMDIPEDFDTILDGQLRRLQTDHIDNYMFHAVERKWWDLIHNFDLLTRMEKAKAAGKVRHIGFSFHDSADVFMQVLSGYDWDFCQIQLNYVDVLFQAGRAGMLAAAEKGLAVIAMEPLLGGHLADPPAAVKEALPAGSPVQAALDFLWQYPQVSVILSGMSSPQQAEDNMRYADESRPDKLNEADFARFGAAREAFLSLQSVRCTGCGYCQPCPFGVEIPHVFDLYNRFYIDAEPAQNFYSAVKGNAALCRECHACEQACPQHLPIAQLMPKIHAALIRAER